MSASPEYQITPPPIEVADRVFVGNLDYHATNEQLENFFREAGYDIKAAEIPRKIITRGEKTIERTLGFGFADFASKEEADRVIAGLDEVEFSGRPIFLKKAHQRKDPSELTEKRSRKPKAVGGEVPAGVDGEVKPKKKRTRTRKAKKPVEGEEGAPAPAPTPKPKRKTTKVPLSEATLSKDTVIVTNLPFTTSMEELLPVFSEFETVSIHVPAKRFSKTALEKMKEENVPVRNKGFAFVKLVNETDVARLIAQFNGFELQDRTLGLEVAMDRPREEVVETAESNTNGAVNAGAVAA